MLIAIIISIILMIVCCIGAIIFESKVIKLNARLDNAKVKKEREALQQQVTQYATLSQRYQIAMALALLIGFIIGAISLII